MIRLACTMWGKRRFEKYPIKRGKPEHCCPGDMKKKLIYVKSLFAFYDYRILPGCVEIMEKI